MAGYTPNSTNISRTKQAIQSAPASLFHPEYGYWMEEWEKIRDALAGQREIKAKGARYLRPMDGSKPKQYEQYLYRAVFYNMTGQTLNGMVGQMFRRPPVIRNLPNRFQHAVNRFAKDGTSHQGFSKTTATEQIALGRFGVLIDAPEENIGLQPQSYAVGYAAENIVDWRIEEVDGYYQPTMVLLREFVREVSTASHDNPWIQGEAAKASRRSKGKAPQVRLPNGKVEELAKPAPSLSASGGYAYSVIYRELRLDRMSDGTRIYVQNLYRDDPYGIPYKQNIPAIRGNPLSFIPFVFFGSFSNAADVEKPPLLDIVDLNLAHYRSYAELEYGRFYTALPTYYAPGNADNDSAEYHIGPGTVWEVPSGETPGILEFKGEGLKTLERSLNEKEAQIAAIGGRLMPGMSKSVSESDNQSQMREANEQSLLLNVVMALEEGMTMLLRYWLMFRDVPLRDSENLRYELDTTFLSVAADARTLRALQQLFEAGILPIDSLYENFIRNGVVPNSTTLEEFTAQMQNPNSFIGQPDAVAMRAGFANRAQQLDQMREAREVEYRARELELEERRLRIEEEKLRISAAVGSTSVSASRKLGDPEQAAPSQAEQETIAVQKTAAKAKAATTTSTPPTSTNGGAN